MPEAKPEVQFAANESPSARVQKLTTLSRNVNNRLLDLEVKMDELKAVRQSLLQRRDNGDIELRELGSRDGFVHRDRNGILTSQRVLRAGEWVDYADDSNIIGWANVQDAHIYYLRLGPLVFVQYLIDGVSGGFLGGQVQFTVPYVLRNAEPNFDMETTWGHARDNGAWLLGAGRVTMTVNTNVVDCFTDMDVGVWTAANQKTVAGIFWYRAEI